MNIYTASIPTHGDLERAVDKFRYFEDGLGLQAICIRAHLLKFLIVIITKYNNNNSNAYRI